MAMIYLMKKFLPLLLLVFLACNELPVGEDELRVRGELDPQFINLTLFSSFTEYKEVNAGASRNLVFGMNDEYQRNEQAAEHDDKLSYVSPNDGLHPPQHGIDSNDGAQDYYHPVYVQLVTSGCLDGQAGHVQGRAHPP